VALGVPVLCLAPAPATEEYEPVTVVYGGRTYAAEAKLRGATSLHYPKNSYTVKFAAGDHFDAPEHAGGFVDKKRIVVTTTFDDNTYVRQRLGFQLWNDMDPGHIQVQAYSAAVYLDGEFWGLYEISDHVDKNLFAAHGLSEEGNVYKSYDHDANFGPLTYEGDPKQTLHDGYTKKDGLPLEGEPGAFDDLDDLVELVSSTAPGAFTAELDERIDVRDFRDWYVFVTYALASDSGGKNCYLYHDPAGGPWRYAPWDLNHSFGQDWQTYRTSSDDFDDFRSRNQLFVRMVDDPASGAALRARYAELLDGPLSSASVLDRFDAMVAETAAVARRDWRKWGAAYAAYPPWQDRADLRDPDGEVVYVRQWLTERGPFLRTFLEL
jgi:spore coat protein H